jgi:hydrogenase expression/formation protein HypC
MCLGVPGKVTRIDEASFGMTMGTVDFGGVRKEVCMAYVPEAVVGDFVLVHVGFALSRIGEEEAREVFQVLEEMGELADIGLPRPSPRSSPEGIPARRAPRGSLP